MSPALVLITVVVTLWLVQTGRMAKIVTELTT